jgi:prevent-host-death family protein
VEYGVGRASRIFGVVGQLSRTTPRRLALVTAICRQRGLSSYSNHAILALMVVATITEAKNGLSALIDQVRAGESVLIMDRGTPVARLESAISAAPDSEGRIARLERVGAVRAARKPPVTDLLSTSPPSPRTAGSAVAALIEERREGR